LCFARLSTEQRLASQVQVRSHLVTFPAPLHIASSLRVKAARFVVCASLPRLLELLTDVAPSHRLDGDPARRTMTSPSSQPSGFAAYFAAQPATTTSSSSTPFIHGLTSPPRTDSPTDTKTDSGRASISDSPAQVNHHTSVPAAHASATPWRKNLDISGFTKRAWKCIHDPDLHPKGSSGRSKPRELRQSGQGVRSSP
jgi:hypothetical protein